MVEDAAGFDLAAADVERGEYERAFFRLGSLARNGHVPAMVLLASIYESGTRRMAANQARAAYWYRKAVFLEDNAVASLALGKIFFNSPKYKDHYKKSWHYFQRALRGGLQEAAVYLGIMLYHGIGIRSDRAEAVTYFDLAVSHGFVIASYYRARVNFHSGNTVSALLLLVRFALRTIVLFVRDRRCAELNGVPKLLFLCGEWAYEDP